MAPNILTSPLPAPFLPTLSLWEYVFPSGPGISPGPGPWPGSTTAYIDGLSGRSVTRAEVRDTALRLKGGLSARGVRRGDTAAIFGSNSIEWALAAWACLAAGVVVTPASSAFGASELAYQLNDSGATVLFVSPELVPVFEACRPALRGAFPAARVLVLAPPGAAPHPAYAGVHDACVGPGPACAPEPEAFDGVAAHSTAWLCYSSGTTGLPKGVQTTHHNLTTQFQTTPLLRPLPAHGADVVLGFLPFSHMYGIFAVVTTPVLAGVPAVILPRYDKRAALRAIETHRVTRFSAVPPVVLGLVHSVEPREAVVILCMMEKNYGLITTPTSPRRVAC